MHSIDLNICDKFDFVNNSWRKIIKWSNIHMYRRIMIKICYDYYWSSWRGQIYFPKILPHSWFSKVWWYKCLSNLFKWLFEKIVFKIRINRIRDVMWCDVMRRVNKRDNLFPLTDVLFYWVSLIKFLWDRMLCVL